MRYLLRLLGSRTPENAEQGEELESQLEKKTRQCYAGAFDIDNNDFVQMMVIDGCFVLELLRLYYRFERELPFFVLKKLFELISLAEDLPLIDLVLTFFDPLMPRKNIKGNLNPEGEFDHMLEVFRSTFLSSVNQDITSGCGKLKISVNAPLVQERQLIHSVIELEEAGVKLKKREYCDLLDINFQAGVLKIPPLYIDDNTVVLFLNFYLMFSDSLINSSADVGILHKNGIIYHVLGSDQDVADLFNNLGHEVVYDLDECYLSQQIKRVNNYCKTYYASKWRVWFTNFKHDYFSNPWTFFSLLAAIVLLLLTTAQTYYTVYGYYIPS
ncbi:hypothetical protein PVL29_025949 [Vitis rotundifolia]|uniref:Uncharacterized protein n=1 Tax=Vitis rotundifolia TaxID=103349 RepID=A0AA38YL94_VITRO|nr:hypothetical protein PVL29_025949 [Vitis rotundifolia]